MRAADAQQQGGGDHISATTERSFVVDLAADCCLKIPLERWDNQRRRWSMCDWDDAVALVRSTTLTDGTAVVRKGEGEASDDFTFLIGRTRLRAEDELDRDAAVELLNALSSQTSQAIDRGPPLRRVAEKGMLIEVHFEDDVIVQVLGTSHVDPRSRQDVADIINKENPDAVIVELDQTRLDSSERRMIEKQLPIKYCCQQVLPSIFRAFCCFFRKEHQRVVDMETIVDWFMNPCFGDSGFGMELVDAVHQAADRKGCQVILGDLDMGNEYHSHAFFDKSSRSPAVREMDRHATGAGDDEESHGLLSSPASHLKSEEQIIATLRNETITSLQAAFSIQQMHTDKELEQRNLKLAYSAMFEPVATSQRRLLVLGWAHVKGVVDIIRRTSSGGHNLMKDWMIIRRGLTQSPKAEGMKESLTRVRHAVRQSCFAQRFIIKSGFAADLVKLLSQLLLRKDENEHVRGFILEILADLFKSWQVFSNRADFVELRQVLVRVLNEYKPDLVNRGMDDEQVEDDFRTSSIIANANLILHEIPSDYR